MFASRSVDQWMMPGIRPEQVRTCHRPEASPDSAPRRSLHRHPSSGYLTVDATPKATTWYRRIGFQANGLHHNETLQQSSNNPAAALRWEHQVNTVLDRYLSQKKRFRNRENDTTTAMRVTEGLGLPPNWRPAPHGTPAKDRVTHHARQLREHINQGTHLANPKPANKLGAIRQMSNLDLPQSDPID
jgi:hypothetical protein